MQKLKRFLAIALISLAACTTTPLLDQEVYALKSVTVLRQASAAKLRAGEITVEREQSNKVIFDAMAKAIKDAVAANNPAAVEATKAKAEKFDVTKGQ